MPRRRKALELPGPPAAAARARRRHRGSSTTSPSRPGSDTATRVVPGNPRISVHRVHRARRTIRRHRLRDGDDEREVARSRDSSPTSRRFPGRLHHLAFWVDSRGGRAAGGGRADGVGRPHRVRSGSSRDGRADLPVLPRAGEHPARGQLGRLPQLPARLGAGAVGPVAGVEHDVPQPGHAARR